MIGDLEGEPAEVLRDVQDIIGAIEPAAMCALRSDRLGIVCWVIDGEDFRVEHLTFRPSPLGMLAKESVRHAGHRLCLR